MIDFDMIEQRLTDACDRYEKTAPTVAEYCNGLYERIQSDPDHVVLSELRFVQYLVDDGTWQHPNYAANNLYKLMYRLGKDTTGHAGF